MKFTTIALLGVVSAIKLKQQDLDDRVDDIVDDVVDALDELFLEYCAEYGYSFDDIDEYNLRKDIFAAALDQIDEINGNPNYTFEAGLNWLTILTEEEKKALNGDLQQENLPYDYEDPDVEDEDQQEGESGEQEQQEEESGEQE